MTRWLWRCNCCGKHFTHYSTGNTNQKGFVGAVKIKRKKGQQQQQMLGPSPTVAKHSACAICTNWAAGHGSRELGELQSRHWTGTVVLPCTAVCVNRDLVCRNSQDKARTGTPYASFQECGSAGMSKAAANNSRWAQGLAGCRPKTDGHSLGISMSICLIA